MAFQFVNVTPNNPGHNDETRRRIRSQAMRDYRRRQRLEEDYISSSSPEESPTRVSSPEASDTSNSRQEMRRRNSNAAGATGVRKQTQSSSRRDLIEMDASGDAKGKRRSPHAECREGARRQKRQNQSHAHPGTFGTFSVTLPKPNKHRATLSGDIDPLNSPGLLDQMLSICESYNRWLLSNSVAESGATAQMNGPWDNPTSQIMLFALSLKSIGHMDALHPGQSAQNRRIFKTKVLALVLKRLKNPAKALEDKTIGALACLASYEVSQGSREAKVHLDGLSQIIRLRGGTNKIGGQGGLSMFLEILDLIHAVYFHSQPMYTVEDRSNPSSTENSPNRTNLYESDMFDLAALEEISTFIVTPPEMEDSDEFFTDKYPPEPTATPSTFEHEVEQWHDFFVQTSRNISPNHTLAYACGLAAGLHLMTTSAVVAHRTRVQAHADELFQAMSSLPDDAWDAFQMLHIRILLTALSNTQSISRKSWYHTHLSRRLYQTEREEWTRVKSLMIRFIEIQTIARLPRTQGVKVLVNGIEVVVDSEEAREAGLSVRNTFPG